MRLRSTRRRSTSTPLQNPYRRGAGLIPGLASSYLDRSDLRPGRVVAGDGVVEAFTAIGWGWRGAWRDPVDHLHVSGTGR